MARWEGKNLRGKIQSEMNALEQEGPRNQEKNTLPHQLMQLITFASSNTALKSRQGGSLTPRGPSKTLYRYS